MEKSNLPNIPEYLVNHIVFPRNLPQEIKCECQPLSILYLFDEALLGLLSNDLYTEFFSCLSELKRLISVWAKIESPKKISPKSYYKNLNSLKPGQFSAFFIPGHNSCIIIYLLNDSSKNEGTISFFDLSLPNKDIMSTSNDVQSYFPRLCYKIKDLELIKSQSFANQLFFLAKSESESLGPRNVNNSCCVHEWILSVASADCSTSNLPKIIVKKIKDNVLWKSTHLPFRREPFYMCVKATLQIILNTVLGPIKGNMIYKIIICKVVRQLCFVSNELSDEVQLQIIQKLAKKIYKVEKNFKEKNFNAIIAESLESCLEGISEVRTRIEKNFQCIINNHRSKSTEVDFCKLNPEDIEHKGLGCELEIKRLVSIDENCINSSGGKLVSPQRYYLCENLPQLSEIKSKNDSEKCIALHDVVMWIRTKLDPYISQNIDSSNLPNKLLTYLETFYNIANPFYEGDPLGYSQMLLAMIHIVCALDQIAVSHCELLLDYKFGIGHEFFEYLLLPQSKDLGYAHSLFKYIYKRNSEATKDSSLIQKNQESNSFASVYYSKSEEMKNLQATILNEAKAKANEKMTELAQKKELFNKLTTMYKNSKCQFIQVSRQTKYGIVNDTVHSSSCNRCSLKKQIDSLSIKFYEWPLPSCNSCLMQHITPKVNCSICQNCQLNSDLVCFELKIPNYVSALRDGLHFCVINLFMNTKWQGESLVGTWIDCNDLSKYTNNSQKFTTFGSTSKLYLMRYYQAISINNDISNVDVFKYNGYNFMYSSKSELITYDVKYTILIDKCCFKLVPPYTVMQEYIRWTDHHENFVISKQGNCPKEIDMKEYIKFGFMRSGNLLQMLNLLDAIETRTLRFNQESVFLLISQCLWQVGKIPNAKEEVFKRSWCPPSHSECKNPKFMKKISESLQQLLKSTSANWADHFVMLNIITISSRLLSMSHTHKISTLFANLLRECRKVCLEWKEKIECIIDDPGLSSFEIIKYKEKLLYICSMGILTYTFDEDRIEMLISSDEDCLNWLIFYSKIYDIDISFKLTKATKNPLSQNLQRQIIYCFLTIEEEFKKICEENNYKVFTDFTKKKWHVSSEGQLSAWKNVPNSSYYDSNFIRNDGLKLLVQIGVNGTFLIQGQPMGKLPKDFILNGLYINFFQATDFEVVPGSGGIGIYITNNFDVNRGTTKKYIVNYTFFVKNEDLIILETRKNIEKNTTKVFQLIPRKALEDCFPHNLIHDYSHWIDKKTKIMQFRPKTYTSEDYHHKVFYVLDLNQKILNDKIHHRQLININSATFEELHNKITSFFELKQYVHVFYKSGVFHIEMPRHNLLFKTEAVKLEGQISHKVNITSHEFRGMNIAEDQRIDTLIGYSFGFVLIEKELDTSIPRKKKILVPHGTLTATSSPLHQELKLTVDEWREPSYFVYEIDERLNILRAGESSLAWLYLAYLHAITSHVLEDPFLKQTGTSRALQILQSGNCWSCKPLSKESINVLSEITQLSPSRCYYPAHLQCMQTVEWPCIHSLCAHEAFSFLAKKLFDDSQQLNFLQTSSKSSPSLDEAFKTNKILARKAYFDGKIIGHEIEPHNEALFETRENVNIVYQDYYKENEKVQNIKLLMSKKYCNETQVTINDFNVESIQGISSNGLQIDNCLGIEPKCYLKMHWIDFFLLAIEENNAEGHKLDMILSYLAFKKVSVGELAFILMISMHKQHFKHINVPLFNSYNLKKKVYSSEEIIKILEKSFITKKKYSGTYVTCGKNETNYFSNTIELTKTNEFKSKYKKRVEKEYLFDRAEYCKKFEEKVSKCFEETCKKIKSATKIFHENIQSIYNLHNRGELYKASLKYEKAVNDMWDCIDLKDKVEKKVNVPTAEIISLCKEWYKSMILSEFFQEISSVSQKYFKGLDHYSICIKPMPLPSKTPKKNFEFILNFSDDTQKLAKINEKCKDFTFSLYETGKLSFWISNANQNSPQITEGPSLNLQEFPITFDKDDEVLKKLTNETKESWNIHKSLTKNKVQSHPPTLESLKSYRFMVSTLISKIFGFISKIYSPSTVLQKILKGSNIWPSMNKNLILSSLLGKYPKQCKLNSTITDLIGALGVLWVYEQRVIRCIWYLKLGDLMSLALQRECENFPHENWSPKERPEWLILEIEMDIMIRPIQVEVCNRMMQPQNNHNSVMQLNMGEGKTSVIIPMMLSVLANQKTLVRVVVLGPLFNINYNSLVFKMGGILNQRIYTFPCNRDIVFDIEKIQLLQNVYQECLRFKGIILTLPEYILSFQLKGLEKCRETDLEIGKKLVDLESWIENISRDILDESDEILSVKYQLVYSIGKQTAISGSNLRWEVTQTVLFLAKNHFDYIQAKYGNDSVEYVRNKEHLIAYPYFRLLNKKAYQELTELICVDILKGKSKQISFYELKESEISHVKDYVLNQHVNEISRELTYEIFKSYPDLLKIVYILRGLFTYEVFYSTFIKRWKVDYGVNLNSKRQLMQAVPYRAKDVPAERAQFEHPDVIINLTCLSYYYSGLSNEQFENVFKRLSLQKSASEEFRMWIEELEKYSYVPDEIREYEGINLSDVKQKKKLFGILKMHPFVIDYWLNTCLFPKEIKEIKSKLTKSAWDLCKTNPNPMTGFSGTNDSKILLPLNASYFEIPELKYTNGLLVSNLLLEENNNYETLEPSATGLSIIEKISQNRKIRILLDVGALMLNLSNKMVAKTWLRSCEENVEAAVFFEDNDLVVINRRDQITEFENSAYRRHLENCIIYLDDSHTRGTDLKLPRNIKGAVTLGRGVTKDRLIQACMRMRMLGNGHTVIFFSSHEVNNKIIKMISKSSENNSLKEPTKITSEHVIKWALKNTAKQIKNGLTFWSIQGMSYFRKESVQEKYLLSEKDYKNYLLYSLEHENMDIKNLYDRNRNEEYIFETAITRTEEIIRKMDSYLPQCTSFRTNIVQVIENLKDLGRNVSRFTQIYEQDQEVELEFELEIEKEPERPKNLPFLKPEISSDITDFIVKNSFNLKSETFVHLPQSLKNSSVYKNIQPSAWNKNLLTTLDYTRTVSTQIIFGDDYLRPPRWAAYQRINQNTERIVLLSGYEANYYKMYFHEEKVSLIMLMPRLRKNHDVFYTLDDIDVSFSLMAQVLVYSGSQYFRDMQELNWHLGFIGFCPSVRSKHKQICFEKDMIMKNGYSKPEFRKEIFNERNDKHGISLFQEDPTQMIMKIAEIRSYGVFSKFADYLIILQKGAKPFENNDLRNDEEN